MSAIAGRPCSIWQIIIDARNILTAFKHPKSIYSIDPTPRPIYCYHERRRRGWSIRWENSFTIGYSDAFGVRQRQASV